MNNSSDHKKFTISIVFFLSLSLSACEFSQKGGSNKDIIESQTPMPNGASETVSLLIPSTKGEQIEKTIGIDIRSDDNALERLLKGKFRNAIYEKNRFYESQGSSNSLRLPALLRKPEYVFRVLSATVNVSGTGMGYSMTFLGLHEESNGFILLYEDSTVVPSKEVEEVFSLRLNAFIDTHL